MRQLSATEFKARCLAVLEDVRRTGEAVTVLKRGRAVARVVPAVPSRPALAQTGLRGTLRIVGDVLAPAVPASAWEAAGRKR